MSSCIYYEADSDESGSSTKRFQTIGVVSGPRDHLVLLRRELVSVLKGKGVKEIKFEKVRGHKVGAASSFYNLAFWTHLFYRCSYFHFFTLLSIICKLFVR